MKVMPNLDKLIDRSLTGGLDGLSEECQATFRLGAELILTLTGNSLDIALALNRFQQTQSITELRDEINRLLEKSA